MSAEAIVDSTADARRLRGLARVMDGAVRIPGTQVRVGLDALIGLIPGMGDLAGGVVALYVLVRAARLGAPPRLLLRMAGNVAVDALAGAIPVVGDIADVAFKANRRNVRLLQAHLEDPGVSRRPSSIVVAGVVGVALLALVGAAAVGVALVRTLAGVVG